MVEQRPGEAETWKYLFIGRLHPLATSAYTLANIASIWDYGRAKSRRCRLIRPAAAASAPAFVDLEQPPWFALGI